MAIKRKSDSKAGEQAGRVEGIVGGLPHDIERKTRGASITDVPACSPGSKVICSRHSTAHRCRGGAAPYNLMRKINEKRKFLTHATFGLTIGIGMKPRLIKACTLAIITLATMSAPPVYAQAPFEPGVKSEFAFKAVYRDETSWIEQAKRSVKTKIPGSGTIRFRNVFINQNKAGNRFACGEVQITDAKGRRGEYKRFISAARKEVTFVEGSVRHFSSGWAAYCSR